MRFSIVTTVESTPKEWLRVWSDRYKLGQDPDDDPTYIGLIAKHDSLGAADFERMGRWKDGAKTDGRWKPNVASVAYEIWKQAQMELPRCPDNSGVEAFLSDWSGRVYTDNYRSGPRKKHFGLSRATTLLHFISAGRFPIYDSRVRAAVSRLTGSPVPPDTVGHYLDTYCPQFLMIAAACATDDVRALDKALFSFGAYNDHFLAF